MLAIVATAEHVLLLVHALLMLELAPDLRPRKKMVQCKSMCYKQTVKLGALLNNANTKKWALYQTLSAHGEKCARNDGRTGQAFKIPRACMNRSWSLVHNTKCGAILYTLRESALQL